MKYSIPSDYFPCSIGAMPTASSATMNSAREMRAPVVVQSHVVSDAPAGSAVAKPAYVPPHMRKAMGDAGGVSAVPAHHVAKAPEPVVAPGPVAYVPPHLRRKTATSEPMTITKLSSADGKKKTDEFPALGGAGVAKPKKSTWSKESSFATIAAAPAPTEEPELETQATTLIRENERLRQLMLAQTRQREIAKFDAMAVRENGGVAFGGGESDDEHGGRGGSDDEGAYDDDDAENDKYYA